MALGEGLLTNKKKGRERGDLCRGVLKFEERKKKGKQEERVENGGRKCEKRTDEVGEEKIF